MNSAKKISELPVGTSFQLSTTNYHPYTVLEQTARVFDETLYAKVQRKGIVYTGEDYQEVMVDPISHLPSHTFVFPHS